MISIYQFNLLGKDTYKSTSIKIYSNGILKLEIYVGQLDRRFPHLIWKKRHKKCRHDVVAEKCQIWQIVQKNIFNDMTWYELEWYKYKKG